MGDSIYEVSYQGTALKKAFSEGLICAWSEKKKKKQGKSVFWKKKNIVTMSWEVWDFVMWRIISTKHLMMMMMMIEVK